MERIYDEDWLTVTGGARAVQSVWDAAWRGEFDAIVERASLKSAIATGELVARGVRLRLPHSRVRALAEAMRALPAGPRLEVNTTKARQLPTVKRGDLVYLEMAGGIVPVVVVAASRRHGLYVVGAQPPLQIRPGQTRVRVCAVEPHPERRLSGVDKLLDIAAGLPPAADRARGPRARPAGAGPEHLYIGSCRRVREGLPRGEELWQAMMATRQPIGWGEFEAACDTRAMLAEGESLYEFAADDVGAGCYRSQWAGGGVYFVQRAGFEFIFADATVRSKVGPPIGAPSPPPRWDAAAQAAASEQGWNIFEVARGEGACLPDDASYPPRGHELQREDEAERFETDEQAHAHVCARAAAGDWVARQALEYLRLHEPAEYETVVGAGRRAAPHGPRL